MFGNRAALAHGGKRKAVLTARHISLISITALGLLSSVCYCESVLKAGFPSQATDAYKANALSVR
jgi:hypothetical protein